MTSAWFKPLPAFLEYEDLSAARRQAVDRVVEKVRETREHASEPLNDGSEAYAYPGPGDSVCFGLNGPVTGHCIARGVRQ